MKTDLYLRFVGSDLEDDSQIQLSDLGRSLIGFENLVGSIGKVCGLNGDWVVTATSSRQGSHIVDTIIQLKTSLGQLPFDSIEHLLEFLKMGNEIAWAEAVEFFKDLNNCRNDLNRYFSTHPLDLTVYAGVVTYLINKARKYKNSPLPADNETSKRIAYELHNLIKKNSFRGFLKPILNESAVSIEISPDRNFRKQTARIDQLSFEDYLNTENEILPELVHGESYALEGEITSLKSTRGDSLTFHLVNKKTQFNLDLFPPYNKTTKNYVEFYKERVVIVAKVERSSMYKKPKLHLEKINHKQTKFDFKNEVSIESDAQSD